MVVGERGRGPGDGGPIPIGAGPGAASGNGVPTNLYVLDGEGKLRAVPVTVGISDGTFTAVRSDSLEEGATVVVGLETGGGRAQSPETVNPFAPRMPGRGGGQRRG
jgi:HlyD family secretion protein